MMSTKDHNIISTLSLKLLSLNPTLLPIPPPITEQTNGNDLCYQNPNIYCKDLEFGMRGVVGSWFLPPQRLIMETITVISISLLLISIVKPYLALQAHVSIDSTDEKNHNANSVLLVNKISRPPQIIRIATTIIYTLQIIYKLCGYPGKIFIMTMPCNVLWTLNMIMCFYKINNHNNQDHQEYSYSRVAYTIMQLQCCYIALVLVALSNPDFSDTVLFGEVYFFYIHHFFLLYYVFHYVFVTGQISTLGPPIITKGGVEVTSFTTRIKSSSIHFVQWLIMSCCYFAIFYFGFVTPLSIKTGLNLNYMLHPPPDQDDLVGEGYRIMSIVYCAVSFAVIRFVIVVLEFIWSNVLQLLLGRQSLIQNWKENKFDNSEKKNV